MRNSRVIKFRAWHKGAQEMLINDLQSNVFRWLEEGQPVELIQYAGLKDNHDNPIYEGDIVNFTYWWFDGNIAESNLIGTIVYCDALMSFQLKGIKNKEWEQFTGYENDSEYLTPFSELDFEEADFEVIGNIYENPELIEKVKI